MQRRNFLKSAAVAVLGLFGVGTAKAVGYRPLSDPKILCGVAAQPPAEVVDAGIYRFAYAGPTIRFPAGSTLAVPADWDVIWPTHRLEDA